MRRSLIILHQRFQVDKPRPTSARRGASPNPNVPADMEYAVKLDSRAT